MGIITGGNVIPGAVPRGVVKQAVISGGAAGAHTVTGIKSGDTLISVLELSGGGTDITAVVNLTPEFSITADNTIDNTGGTATTGDQLLVTWSTQAV